MGTWNRRSARPVRQGGARGFARRLPGAGEDSRPWAPRRRSAAAVVAFAVSAACAFPAPAPAQDSAAAAARMLHPEATEAISKIRSPFCPGLMLEVCPSPPAEALRDSLDARAKEGLRADSLVEMVVASYGEEYRAFPKTSGAGLWAWAMPPLALAAGLALALAALRRLRAPAGSSAPAALSDEEQERVRQALADFERNS